jgi:outer membrane immunogenic protein
MMRKSLLWATALTSLPGMALLAGTVFAADIEPDVVGPYYSDWSGLYIGAYAGGGAVVNEINLDLGGAGLGLDGIGGEGWLGGVMGGYNFQMNNFVFGIQGEAGYNALETEFDLSTGGVSIIDLEAQQGFVAAASLRLGMLLSPEALAYLIGGYSYSKYDVDIGGLVGSADFDETYHGWHAGFGLEGMVSSNVTLRAEYRYTSYNEENWGVDELEVAPSTHTGTLGLAWMF